MEIKTTERDFEVLVINAFRYAMPRFMTAAFDPVERIVFDNIDLIQTWVLKQWVRNIDEERRIWECIKDKPGIFADNNPSVRDDFYNNIKAEIERRECVKREQGKGNATA